MERGPYTDAYVIPRLCPFVSTSPAAMSFFITALYRSSGRAEPRQYGATRAPYPASAVLTGVPEQGRKCRVEREWQVGG
jgi:hypothetical protein